MLLGDKFGTSSQTHTTSSITFEDQGQAELAWYKAEPQSPLDHNPPLRWHDHTSSYPLLGRLSRKYLCLPTALLSICSTSVVLQSMKKEQLYILIMWTK